MASDANPKEDSKNILYCSFCGKSQHEVRKLIAGPMVFICDECVELCMDIIREETRKLPTDFAELQGENAIDTVRKTLRDIAPGNRKFLNRIINDAIGFHTLKLGNTKTVNSLKMLFVGPRGCDIVEFLNALWELFGYNIVVVDSTNLRESVINESNDFLLRILKSSEFNIERAQTQTVVIIKNIERICKSSDEYMKIQEDLELLIDGTFVQVPPQGGRKQLQQENLTLDTSQIIFFATTSILHENIPPIVAKSGKKSFRYIDMQAARQELTVRGMLPALVNAFDDVVEYDPMTIEEVSDFLLSERSMTMLNELAMMNVNFDEEAIPKIIDFLVARGEGMDSLRSIINLVAIRVAFSQSEATKHELISKDWLDSNI